MITFILHFNFEIRLFITDFQNCRKSFLCLRASLRWQKPNRDIDINNQHKTKQLVT